MPSNLIEYLLARPDLAALLLVPEDEHDPRPSRTDAAGRACGRTDCPNHRQPKDRAAAREDPPLKAKEPAPTD